MAGVMARSTPLEAQSLLSKNIASRLSPTLPTSDLGPVQTSAEQPSLGGGCSSVHGALLAALIRSSCSSACCTCQQRTAVEISMHSRVGRVT